MVRKNDLTTADLDWIKSKRVGLVLSGGGGHGFGELGAVKVLEEYGIIPVAITGCSVGSLIGTCVASGKSILVAEEEFTSLNPFLLADFTIKGLGFLKGDRLIRHILNILEVNSFKDLNIPLTVIATNINNGKVRAFNRGKLHPVLGASIAVPGLFAPKKIGTQYYADGGLYSPIPIEFLPPGLDVIIVVDVSERWQAITSVSSAFHVLQNSVRIMTHALTKRILQQATKKHNLILIEPPIQSYSFFDIRSKHVKEMIKIGEQSTRKALKNGIRRLRRAERRLTSQNALPK
ncbi:patatin-like phospholipase family protein [Candidatus Woesearchaeota archaeon]|nr:patatin-like phospholipase family protein [Candidatus Woesearchaeota archaeon]